MGRRATGIEGEGERVKAESDSGGRFTWLCLAALVAAVAARFVRLDIDAPYNLIGTWSEFLTDEGWYSKSAQLRVKFGDWASEHDTAWLSHNTLFTMLQTAAFTVFGVSATVARIVSVLAFTATLGAFYVLVRMVQSRPVALLTCLVAAVTLHTFGYSRLAMVEPTGTACSMLALAAWARPQNRFAACTAGLLFASAAYFSKVSFIFTMVALVLLALGDGVLALRERRWGRAAAIGLMTAGVPIATWALQQAASGLAPEQAATFAAWHVDSRMRELSLGACVLNEAKAVYKLAFATGGLALAGIMALAVPVALVRAGRFPAFPWPRPVIALLLWGVGGVSFMGLFEYQPARYFYFAIFPLAFLAVLVACSLVPERLRTAAAACVLLVHIAVQVPGYAAWLGRGDLASADSAAREAVARIRAETGPEDLQILVIGGTASFLGLYDDRIRPLDFRWNDHLLDRATRWRPRYLYTVPSNAQQMVAKCPGLVDRIEFMTSHRIMDDGNSREPYVLYRVVYSR